MVKIFYAAAYLLSTAMLVCCQDPSGARNVGLGTATQFITGGCVSNADCASACCAGNPRIGVCSGVGAQFQNGKTGCGFVDPNRDATIAAAKAQVAKQGFKRSRV